MPHSFNSWLDRRRRGPPEADRILPLVAAAGVAGLNRGQLGHAVRLDRDVLDQLLVGFLQTGLLTVADENGFKVFRSAVNGLQ